MDDVWESLNESTFVKRFPIYSMTWNVKPEEIRQGFLISSKNGGAVACLRYKDDEAKEIKASVFNQAGVHLIDLFPSFERHDRLARGGAGWIHDKDYFIFVSLTQVRVFRLNGVEFSFSLNNESDVVLCHCSFGGILTIHEDASITLVTELESLFKPKHRPKVNTFRKFPFNPSNALAVVATSRFSKKITLFLSFMDGSLIAYSINPLDGVVLDYQIVSLPSPIAKMALCNDESKLAVVDLKGGITILNAASLNEIITQFDTGSINSIPNQLIWNGNETTVTYWEELNSVLLVTINNDWVKYSFNREGDESNYVHLIEEKDCTRVVSVESNELIQIIPRKVLNALKIGSFSSSALLLDATTGSDLGKFNETIQCLKKEGTLTMAIDELIETALFEFDLSKQERLLKGALKGKRFIVDEEEARAITAFFHRTLKHLRLLNVIREQKIGLPMTWDEFGGVSYAVFKNVY